MATDVSQLNSGFLRRMRPLQSSRYSRSLFCVLIMGICKILFVNRVITHLVYTMQFFLSAH